MTQRSPWGARNWGLGLALVGLVAGGCSRSTTQRTVIAPDEQVETAEEVAAPEVATAAIVPATDPLTVQGIKLVEDGGQTGVFVKLNRVPTEVKDFTLQSPNRIVLDLYGPVGKGVPIEAKPKGDPRLARVRVGYGEGRIRVSFDVKGETPQYTLNTLDSMVVAFLGERGEGATSTREEVLYAAVDAPAPAASRAGMAQATITDAPIYDAPKVFVATSERPRAFTGQKISLDFKDADVQNVLRILAEVGNVNIVATDDVKGRITLRLVDVPWDQA
ncbi:MAG: AMIN domain-containing protein, partial [Candidatus Binatia bacterium]